jgi:hypothetical protein
MPDFDFNAGSIRVKTGAVKWGPFAFDFTASVPPGDSVGAVSVTATAPDGTTDSTGSLIQETNVVGNVCEVYFKFPGGALVGSHTLRFMVTFASGAEQPFDFGYVRAEV